jgi:RNA polymerase sigma-70 factor (ECF subfamily)
MLKAQEVASSYVFADLVDEHCIPVYKFCRSLAYSKEDADDLFQETFLRVAEQPTKLQAFDSPRGFLFSTTLYIWKSWKRKHARRRRIAPTEILDESNSNGADLEDSVIAREQTRIVQKVVASLPDKFRIPIILHYTMEMSVADMAQSLRLPSGTVKSRLYKARKLVEKGLVGAL